MALAWVVSVLNVEGQTAARVKELGTKLASNPVLPVLGFTKFVESIVSTGPTLNWAVYTILVTLVWIFADDIRRNAGYLDDAVDDAAKAAAERYDVYVDYGRVGSIDYFDVRGDDDESE